VSILQTVAVFVLAPLGLYVLIALLVLVPHRIHQRRRPKGGPGWDYPAQWWAGSEPVASGSTISTPDSSRGGARGTW
jgi:hypothetical protein